jgi:hypothetical protein
VTITACDGCTDDDAIAELKVSHLIAYFFNDAHALMSENGSRFHPRHRSADHMKVSSAYRTSGQSNDRVRWFFDFWIRNVFHSNVANIFENQSFHEVISDTCRGCKRCSGTSMSQGVMSLDAMGLEILPLCNKD